MRGTLETIVGAMFAGKTSELLKRILWAEHQGNKILVIKPKVDNRYSVRLISTHNDLTHDCYPMVDWNDVKNADVFIITAGIPRKPGMDREDLLEINLGIMKDVAENIKTQAPNSFVIVISNPLDAMVYAFYKTSGFQKNKVVGMAGALDSTRFSTFIAMETGLSVQDVTCMVLGGHGDTMVPITRLATIGGVPVTDLISKEKLSSIEEITRFAGGEIVKLFGNGSAFYAPAQSAIEMAESYLRDKKRVIPCASLCNGEFGIDGYFIGVPTVIGANGVEKILEFELEKHEQDALNQTLNAVKKTVSETGL